jgi:hypothetical protein
VGNHRPATLKGSDRVVSFQSSALGPGRKISDCHFERNTAYADPMVGSGKIEGTRIVDHGNRVQGLADAQLASEVKRLRTVKRRRGCPVLFHVTRKEAADAILTGGFRDGNNNGGIDLDLVGVWLSNRHLDSQSGAFGDTVLILTFCVPLRQLRQFEVCEQGKPYREWVIPASFITRFATVSQGRLPK